MQAVDDIVAELGSNPAGSFGTVESRLNAVATNAQFFRQPVRVATVNGVTYTLATSFENGDVVDGVTLATGDRILINSLGTAGGAHLDHGVYTVNASGTPTRASDFDTGSEFIGAAVAVTSGTLNAGQVYLNTNSSVTIGSTNISFIGVTKRSPKYNIVASNAAIGQREADFICDGTADEVQFTLACFFLAIAAFPRGEIELSSGTFTFGAAWAPAQSNLTVTGQGRNSTLIARSANVVAVDLIGAYTAGGSTAAHRTNIQIRDLRLSGSITPHTQPAMRIYYGTGHVFERVDFAGMTSMGVAMVEVIDATFRDCRWSQCGTIGAGAGRTFGAAGLGSGANPSTLLMGDTALSSGGGFGHTDQGCRNVRFDSCTWEAYTDGALLAHGNGTAEDFAGQLNTTISKMWVTNCRFESNALGFGPSVRFYRCHASWFQGNAVLAGPFAAGGTAEVVIDFDTCSAFTIRGLFFETQGASAHRSIVRFATCQAFDVEPIKGDDAASVSPTVAIVEMTGTNDYWERQPRVQIRFRNAHSPALTSGAPTTCKEMAGFDNIPTGSTVKVITHGLPSAPNGAQIALGYGGTSTNDPGPLWPSAMNATTFTANCRNDPGASGLLVFWKANLNNDQGHL